MLSLLLAFSLWPAPVIEFGPPRVIQPGQWTHTVNVCCGSMRPLLNAGERVHVRKYIPGEPLRGRVVSDGRRLHIVVEETKRFIRTGALNGKIMDPGYTPKTAVEYVVVYVETAPGR